MRTTNIEHSQSMEISINNHMIRDGIRMVRQNGSGGGAICYKAAAWTSHTVEIGFNMGGSVRSVLYAGDRSQGQELETGQACIAFYPGCSGMVEYCGNQPVCFLGLLVCGELFEEFFDMRLSEMKEQIHEQKTLNYVLVSPITAEMKLALHQMTFCPFRGKTRELFWEAKVLELVSYLRQTSRQLESRGRVSLTADDHEKMWRAKKILDGNLESPPSIIDLARRVGVNEFKLKNGFRQVHGVTPYRYLADQRLEMARRLLCERQANVSEAAVAVGYSSLSHFSRIFKTKYGVSPHEYTANFDQPYGASRMLPA